MGLSAQQVLNKISLVKFYEIGGTMVDNPKNCLVYTTCNHKDCADNVFCLRKYKLDFLYESALLSPAQRKHITLYIDNDGTDIEEFKKLAEIETNIEAFISAGKNLYLHSTTSGNGKTSWSIRMIEAYFNKIWPKTAMSCRALFISVPRFLLALKDNISNKNDYVEYIKANIMSADLVVWDDIAAKIGSEFELNHLLSLIDGRITLGKSNIFTSNLGEKEMYNALGSRLTRRICHMSIDIQLHGADKRIFTNYSEN